MSFTDHCKSYLETLCTDIPGRSVGSAGNRQATDFFEKTVSSFGWKTEVSELSVMDWRENGATLLSGNNRFEVRVSPYSPGCDVRGKLISLSTIPELEQAVPAGHILLLHGEITREQLMPKNFPFYNPEEHRRIISLLEEKKPSAIISATGRNSALAGGVYPFPLIEDGDFDIPSVYMTEEECKKLLPFTGGRVHLKSESERIPEKAFNVIARKGVTGKGRIVITAHIDAKKGTPGAIDNATGVIILLLLAEMLQGYKGSRMLEIVAFNGEDYYATPGQMNFIEKNRGRFGEILLNINIDGAGYMKGPSSFSLFGLPEALKESAQKVIAESGGITEGILWPQGDHSIFVQQGCPAIAVSSEWLIDHMDRQTLTHTPRDHPGIVDCRKVVDTAMALNELIRRITHSQ